MFEDEANDDLPAGRAPLPPEDRLWRHPSEVGAAAGPPIRPAAPEPRRSLLTVALVACIAGFTGAAIAVALLAVTGSFTSTVTERTSNAAARAATTAIPASAPSPRTVKAAAAASAPAVAHVEVSAGRARRAGSAVVMRGDGTLVTSEALVRGATTITVTLSDGRTFTARLLGTDPATGLAAIRVSAVGLVAARPADEAPRPGDRAVTVAGRDEPGTAPAATAGVVRAVDREVPTSAGVMWGLIQTDRPVPAAADGGALVSDEGRVTGIALAVHTPGTAIMGYAVPLDLAGAVADDLVAHGTARWAWLGIEGDDLAAAEARSRGIEGGVVVSTVTGSGPAAAAGVEAQDVVVGVGDDTVTSMATLVDALRTHEPGETLVLVVLRGSAEQRLTVTLATRP